MNCQEDLVLAAAREITGNLKTRLLLTNIGNFLPCFSSRRAKVCVRGKEEAAVLNPTSSGGFCHPSTSEIPKKQELYHLHAHL